MNRVSYTITEARRLIGLSHSKIYEELNSGRLRAVKCGRRTLVPHEALEEWIASLRPYIPEEA